MKIERLWKAKIKILQTYRKRFGIQPFVTKVARRFLIFDMSEHILITVLHLLLTNCIHLLTKFAFRDSLLLPPHLQVISF